jgi:hypothetical protein
MKSAACQSEDQSAPGLGFTAQLGPSQGIYRNLNDINATQVGQD